MYSDKIKQLRKQRGMTQFALAEQIGVSKSAIGMYEQGRREPDATTLVKLAKFFGVSVDYLLDTRATEQPIGTIDGFADQVRDMLMSQNGLMFSGVPLYEEDIDMIVEAVREGVNIAFDRKNSQ